MPNYKRYYTAGQSIFITLVTFQRKPLLIDHIEQWRHAMKLVQAKHPFRLPAAVVLPDHCHFIMDLSAGDGDFSHENQFIQSHLFAFLAKSRR